MRAAARQPAGGDSAAGFRCCLMTALAFPWRAGRRFGPFTRSGLFSDDRGRFFGLAAVFKARLTETSGHADGLVVVVSMTPCRLPRRRPRDSRPPEGRVEGSRWNSRGNNAPEILGRRQPRDSHNFGVGRAGRSSRFRRRPQRG